MGSTGNRYGTRKIVVIFGGEFAVIERKLVIYGAGRYGRHMLQFLQSMGTKADFFCQTQASDGMKVEGIPVLSFDELCNCSGKMSVFIAIADPTVSRRIHLRLASVLLEKVDIWECGTFLAGGNFTDDCLQKKYCILCGNAVDGFLAADLAGTEKLQLFREHHIIGGGQRENCLCPVCGGIDRERWQLWVLSNYTGIFREKCRVLHFAPEPHISEFIAANPNCDYYTGDIVPGIAMHQMDVLDIQYKNGTFDYVIMNHVIEHIEDMEIAMDEVKRVLKLDGKLIISFPICTDMDTLEIPGVFTNEERLEHYGQEDHVRLFGKDFKKRISDFGFEVEVFTPREILVTDDVKRYGFIEDDVLMVCRKGKS